MDTQNTSRQFRYLEEVRIPLHRADFGTLPVEGDQLPVLWNGAPLCRIGVVPCKCSRKIPKNLLN